MKVPRSKNIGYIILSVIAGIAVSIATFFALIFFFFATGLFGWSDGGEKEYLDRLERNTNITFFISIIVAIASGVFVIFKMNRTKKKGNDSSPADTL